MGGSLVSHTPLAQIWGSDSAYSVASCCLFLSHFSPKLTNGRRGRLTSVTFSQTESSCLCWSVRSATTERFSTVCVAASKISSFACVNGTWGKMCRLRMMWRYQRCMVRAQRLRNTRKEVAVLSRWSINRCLAAYVHASMRDLYFSLVEASKASNREERSAALVGKVLR